MYRSRQYKEFKTPEEYAQWLSKFEDARTTDECHTPPDVYRIVHDWAVKEYKLEGREILRPFFPGGDYEAEEYPEGCVVLDNPPFSLISKIVRFYLAKNIDFFLFAPHKTLFSIASGQASYIATNTSIIYSNGAEVSSGFVTNLDPYKIRTAPELARALNALIPDKSLPKHELPTACVTALRFARIAQYGIDLKIPPEHTHFIRQLESQKADKKSLYGAGFLLSEEFTRKYEQAKREAEQARTIVYPLSESERIICQNLAK